MSQRIITEFDALVDTAPNVLLSDALKHLAKPYVDGCWS